MLRLILFNSLDWKYLESLAPNLDGACLGPLKINIITMKDLTAILSV